MGTIPKDYCQKTKELMSGGGNGFCTALFSHQVNPSGDLVMGL